MSDQDKKESSPVIEALERMQNKLEEKFEKVDTRLDSIEKVQIEQKGVLDIHVYRTDLAEKKSELLEEQIKENTKVLASDLKDFKKEMVPVKRHVDYMNGALKFVGILAALAAIVSGAVALASLL